MLYIINKQGWNKLLYNLKKDFVESTAIISTIITSVLAGVLFTLEIYRILKNLLIKNILKTFYNIHSNYLKIIPYKNMTEYNLEWFKDKNNNWWSENNTWINVNYKLLNIHHLIMDRYLFNPTDYHWWGDNKLFSLKNTLENINLISLAKLSLKYKEINKRISKINFLLTEKEIIMDEGEGDFYHYVWNFNFSKTEINKVELIPYWIKDNMNYVVGRNVVKKKITFKYDKTKFNYNALWGFAVESNENKLKESRIIFLFNKNNITKIIIYYRKSDSNYSPINYSVLDFVKLFKDENSDENIRNSILKIRKKDKDNIFSDFDWICYSIMILFEFMKKLNIEKEKIEDLIKDGMNKRLNHVSKIITFLENEDN